NSDVRQRRPRKTDDRGQFVEDRREKRGARVGNARDDALRSGVHQYQHVVRRREPPPAAPHRRGLEHPRPRPYVVHRRWNVAVTSPLRSGAVVELDEEVWLVLHEVRLRGVADLDPGDPTIDRLLAHGLVSAGPRGVRVTVDGRAAHTTWARLSAGSD